MPVFSYTSERNLLEGLVVPETPVASLFDFGEERVETLAPGVFVFGQSGLEQTPEAKFAGHAKRAATVRALVRLATDKRISEAVEIHLREVKSSGCVEIDNCDGASGGDPGTLSVRWLQQAIRPPETIPPAKVDRFHGDGPASPDYNGEEG